jgi:opacity protein-like surface antigen
VTRPPEFLDRIGPPEHHSLVNWKRLSPGALRGLTALFLTFAPVALHGQSSETDVGEVALHAGGTFGAGTHGTVGASSGFAFSPRGMAFLDANYTWMAHDILWKRPGVQSPQDSRLFEFMATTHIRFPVTNRIAPYAILGGGLLFNTFRAYSGPQGALIGIDDFKFGAQGGGGVRFYLGENWGIRPEFKVTVSSQTYTRMSIGVFYNIPSFWP